MVSSSSNRRRPSVQISLARASRLYRLVASLDRGGQPRETLLGELSIGLRTFYRELVLLRRCGVRIRLENKRYVLSGTAEQAEGRLPFPDPQLSFAEMAELAGGPGAAAQRLAALYAGVIGQAGAPRTPRKGKPA